MIKWYRTYKVTRYCANVLTRNHAITSPDESASALYCGEVVSWRYGVVVVWQRGTTSTW